MSDTTAIAAGIARLTAPNPSAMTDRGTNTYLVGTDTITIVDPGPASDAHLAAILAVLRGRRVGHIVVTHAHRDHSALAPALSRITGAPVCGHSGPRICPAMARAVRRGLTGGGEGIDPDHRIDVALVDGGSVGTGDAELSVIHTPGHLGDHICLAREGVCLTGDHVMGWSSTLVSPPEGCMACHVASLHRLAVRDWSLLLPGHGDAVTDPAARLAALIAHRASREAAIRAEIARAPATPAAIARTLYADTPAALHGAATRNVLAHLIALEDAGNATSDGPPGPDTPYRAP